MSIDLKGTLAYLFDKGAASAKPEAPSLLTVKTGPNNNRHYVTRADGEIDTFDEYLVRALSCKTKSIAAFVEYAKATVSDADLGVQHKYIAIDNWGAAKLVLSGGDQPSQEIDYTAPFTRQFQALFNFAELSKGMQLHEAARLPKHFYDFVMEYEANVEDSGGLMEILRSLTVTMKSRTDLGEAFFGVAGANFKVTITNGDKDTEVRLPRGFTWHGRILSDDALIDDTTLTVSTTPNVIQDKLVFGISLEDALETRLNVCKQVQAYLAANLKDLGLVLLID